MKSLGRAIEQILKVVPSGGRKVALKMVPFGGSKVGGKISYPYTKTYCVTGSSRT